MPQTIDTKDAQVVAAATRTLFLMIFPATRSILIDRLFADVSGMFAGKFPGYLACDTRYHDFEHTLQATLCLVRLLTGHQQVGAEPLVTQRQFELGLAAVLLHDTGYLKRITDLEGTGAKYTFCHVQRSCDFATDYLPFLGFTPDEIVAVQHIISGTGPRSNIEGIPFADSIEKFLGRAVATADYLGQMAAPDYPDELTILFNEFHESDNFEGVPQEKRIFHSARELMEKTPAFWEKFVRPKLENDFAGVYRFLADPFPDGPNPYFAAVERNIARIRCDIAALKPVGC